MANWTSSDTKMRSHLGKSLALSLLIAGVWPMAAMAEEISAALPTKTDLLEDIGTEPETLKTPKPATSEPEIKAVYSSPYSELQLALDPSAAVPENVLSPLTSDQNSLENSDQASATPSASTNSQPQPTPLLQDELATKNTPQVKEAAHPVTAPRTLAEAGWTTDVQVMTAQPETIAPNSATEILSQPLSQKGSDTSTEEPQTAEESGTPSDTQTESTAAPPESLGIPYFVDTEFRGSTRRQFGGLNLRLPLWQDDKSYVFTDVHFEAGSSDTFLGNLGLAYRRILNTSEENPWVLGTHAFYDSKRSENGFQYHQGSIGAEIVNKKFEFRVNGYLPGNNSNVVGQRTVNGVLGLQPRTTGLGTNLVQQNVTLEARERALAGFDFETGLRHHFSDKVSLGLFGGYFFFDSSQALSIDGPMARAQLEVQDPLGMNGGLLQVGSRFRFDEIRGSELDGFVRLGIPFGGPKRSDPINQRLRLARRPIERNYEITTFAQDLNRPIPVDQLQAALAGRGMLSQLGPQLAAFTSQVALDPATGQPINIFFIDGDGTAGSGTQGNPLTIAQASALTQANDVLFFLNDAGTINTQTGTGGTLSLKEGQQALGVGTTPNFVFTVPNLGSVTVFDAGQPQLVNGANNNLFTLANNNTIEGLAFNGQNTAPRGIAAVTGATNTTIRNSSFSNFTVAGIQITPSTNTTIDNAGFNNNATDVIVNAANTTLTNVVSTNATGPAFQILNATGTTTLTNVDISNSGGDGLQFANPSGTITATNVDIANAGDNSIDITGGDGTFTFDTTSSITNATGSAFNVLGGTTTVTYNGTITQNNPASAVNIADKTGGTTTFNGLVTANTSTAPGVNLMNNAGSTIAFNGGLDIDTTTGTGFNATNGGTVNVAATAADESVTTTAGTAINLNGVMANITFDAVSSTGGTNGINLDTVTGSVGVSGTTTIANATGDGFLAANSTGTYTFGPVAITNAGLDGVDLSGISDATTVFNFGALTINGFTGSGINLAGANVGVTAPTVAITNTGNVGTGIDLSNTMGNRVITLGDPTNTAGDTPSSIAGVNVGVQLNNANANFTFGDGELTVDAPSTIAATTPIDASAVGANGTYNFRDVAFAGSPGLGFTFPDVFFVDQNTNGTGASITDPGSITAAEASATADVFILVNTSGADVIDAINAGGTFDLTANQQILSFRDGSTLNIPFMGPGNVLLNASTGSITDTTGNGAPTLTTTGAGTPTTVSLANNNTISGVVLDNVSNGTAVSGTGLVGTATIQQSTLPTVDFNGGTVNVNITDSTLNNGNSLATINVNGGHTGALMVDTATTINATNGTGLQFDNADGTYTFNGPITLNGGDAGIDILNGSAGTFTFSTNTSITSPTGTAFNEDTSTASVTYAGTITQNNAASAVNISSKTGNTTAFNGLVTANTTTATGINLTNNTGGTINFTGGLDIDTTTGTGFLATGGSTVNGTGTNSITVAGAAANTLRLENIEIGGSGLNFDSIQATGTGANALTADGIDIDDVTGGTFNGGAVTIAQTTGSGDGINITNSSAVFNFASATLDNTGDDGIELSGANGNITFATVDIDGTNARGISILNPTNNININGGTLGAVAPISNGFGFLIQNQAAGSTITTNNLAVSTSGSDAYALTNNTGTINILGGSATHSGVSDALDITNGSATVNFGADIVHTFNGSQAVEIDGTSGNITISGTVTATNSSPAVNIGGNSVITGGQILFTGSTISSINSTGTGISIQNVNAGASVDVSAGTTVTVTNPAGVGINLQNNAGVIAFNGPTTINNPMGNAIALNNNSGTVTFGTVNIDLGTTASTSGIRYIGTNAATTFGTTTITDVGAAANQVGINFNGATLSGTAAYNSVAISGPDTSTSSIGVDLTALAGNQTVNLGTQTTPATGPSSSITDLHRGVVIDNTAAVQFTFGDGESASDTGSSINVNAQAGAFTIDAGNGTLAASSFDFEDVTFGAGDAANFPAGAASATFVSQSGGTLTAGTFGLSQSISTISVAAADLLAGTETFAFIGNIDVTAQGATGFTLATGQSITGFANTNSVSFGSTKPANILGTFSTVGGTVTANSAVITNSTAGSDVLTLGGNNTIEHNTFEYSAGTANVFDIDNATAGFSSGTGITLQNNLIQNVGVNATVFNIANLTTNVTAQNNTINVAGELLNANGGTGNITLTRGTGTAFSARNINVANKTGGTVAITGPLTLNSGTVNAVNLASNTGATINFAGGTLDIDTTTGIGFNAINGGTVNVTGTVNTINSGATTALNIANTTIGTSGVTFQSISANGGTNGINLNNVGSGGFNVTGDGATLGSGGLIDNSTGAGIRLSNAQNISLSFIDITDGGDDGIFGDNVNGFTLASGRILRNGNANGESGIQFGDSTTPLNGVTGAVSITDSLIDSSQSFGIDIRNSSGTLSSLAVTGNTISNNTQDSAFVYEGTGTSVLTTANIANNTIQNIPASAFIINVTDQGTADVVLDGNTITGTNTFGQITSNLSAVVNFDIRNHGTAGNPVLFSSTNSDGINLLLGSQSTTSGRLQGNIDNNFISLTDTNNFLGENITAIAEGNGTLTITITDNTLVNAGFQEVIRLFARDGDNTFNATVTGNAVTQSNIFGLEGIFFQSGATGSATDDINACADIGGAGALANTVSAAGGTDDIRLRLRSSTDSFVLPGFTGSGTSGVDVANYLAGRNNSTSDNITIDAGLTFSGGVSCPTPP